MAEPPMAEHGRLPRGLSGVSVTESSIAKSEPDGTLVYRGYPIGEIAANATFEEAAFLVLRGRLPKMEELRAFNSELKAEMPVDPAIWNLIASLRGGHPMDIVRTAVSALGSFDGASTVREQELSVEAKTSVIAANCVRVPKGEKPIEHDGRLGFAADMLRMLTGKEPAERDAWYFERVLIFYMEHDLNASSFTVRVVASTLADPYAAATAGLAALKGPLHGGANEAAMRMLLEVREPAKVGPFLDQAFEEGRKIIGFGHRVYKKFDPRAVLCKQYLKEMLASRGADDGLYRLCDAFEREMWERKRIPPNLDFYAAPIFHLLGIEIPLYTPIFASSRVFGWMAHYEEQVAENKLIRPDADYVGPTGLKYVPIGSR